MVVLYSARLLRQRAPDHTAQEMSIQLQLFDPSFFAPPKPHVTGPEGKRHLRRNPTGLPLRELDLRHRTGVRRGRAGEYSELDSDV